MSDLELWKQLKEGNREAFKKIYAQHIQSLYKYGRRFTQDTTMVEDSIHDLFVELWNKRSSIGNTDSIIRYLLVSLRRKLYKATKASEKIELKDELVSAEEQSFQWPEDDSNPRKVKLQQAIKKLTPHQQEVIYLKYFQGLDYEEISEVLDMKYQSVRNLVHRAMTKLRDHLHVLFLFFFIFDEYKRFIPPLYY